MYQTKLVTLHTNNKTIKHSPKPNWPQVYAGPLQPCLDYHCKKPVHHFKKPILQISHSFTPNCEFDLFDHPRFGIVHCVVTLADVVRGQELSVNYGYRLSTAPLWYFS